MSTIVSAYPHDGPAAERQFGISANQVGGLLWNLRFQVALRMLQQALASARLRTSLVLLLSIVFWVVMFVLFQEGFSLILGTIDDPGTLAHTFHAIFNLFFLSLFAMLTVSTAIVLYSTAYRSDEVRYLLTTPAHPRRILLYKYQESTLFSGWGFFLLGSPILMAYGSVVAAPWYYFALLLPFMLAFVLIPSGLGTLACMVVVRYLPTLRYHTWAIVAFGGIVCLAVFSWSLVNGVHGTEVLTPEWFQASLARLRYTQQELFPSYWLSTGLLEAAHPAEVGSQSSIQVALGMLNVLAANAMMMYLLVGWCAQRLFTTGYSELARLSSSTIRQSSGRMESTVHRLAFPLPLPMRLLLIKDIRGFLRDTTQWSQFVIFFSLLAFYFLNVRRFQFGSALPQWIVTVGTMNVAVVGLILATFTTRFIFPMISLEGRRFWILGTLPIDRGWVLWSKFLFSCGISLVPCSLLIALSDIMLQIHTQWPIIAVVHQIECAALCCGLSALAVGLGARLPNLRETSPSKIAAGFGGTLNLVLSTGFILATVLISSVPVYFWVHEQTARSLPSRWLHQVIDATGLGSLTAVVVGAILVAVLGAITTIVPMRTGVRSFRRL
jgi:ABC-2 type transport system permease protein